MTTGPRPADSLIQDPTLTSLSVVRVLVVDDEPFARAAIRMLLSGAAEIFVVGEAHDGEQALRQCQKLSPDVVVLDLHLPDLDGADVASRLLASSDIERAPAILALTCLGVDETLMPALRSGMSGYVLKDSPETLLPAVRAVAQGHGWLDPIAVPRIIETTVSAPVNLAFSAGRLQLLTGRERDVLTLAGEGHSNERIARKLYIAETTVKTHMSSVLLKLGVQDRTQAVIVLLRAQEQA